jgi:CarD family transcriptional regulator
VGVRLGCGDSPGPCLVDHPGSSRACRRGPTTPLTSGFVLRWKGSACYPAYPVIQIPLPEGGFVTFRKGDTVVHPEHGAAVIEEVRIKEFLGEKRKYLVLRVVYGDLTVLVPIDSTDQVGLRPCVSKNEAKKVLKVLTEDESSVAANWSRRFKNNLEKLHSGDPYEVAEVLRNLAIRDREKGLSAGEKRMITKARQILISELSFATEKSEDEAEAMIDGILDDSHGVKATAAQA